MICPVCDQAMVIVEYRDIELDYCTNCKGVWFDSGELELLLETADLENYSVFIDDIVDKPEANTSEKKRKCPICNAKMKKAFIDEGNQILIDICRQEHGIWFDNKEVHHLLSLLAGKSPDKKGSSQQVMNFLADIFKYEE
jgi:Zn-finger nucleic acid-binding protein